MIVSPIVLCACEIPSVATVAGEKVSMCCPPAAGPPVLIAQYVVLTCPFTVAAHALDACLLS